MGGDNDIGYDANDQQERGGRGRAGDVQHRTARDAARRRLARGVVERVDQRRAVAHVIGPPAEHPSRRIEHQAPLIASFLV